jgi:hypothetical protein
VERNAGRLTGHPDARNASGAVDVGLDAPHRVVSYRTDGDRFLDRIDTHELHADLADEWQPGVDALCPQVGQVEMKIVQTIGPFETAALLELGHLGSGDHIAGPQFHLLRRVALEESLALGVLQVASLTAAALRDQDARGDQTGGVELEKLHVLQRQPGPIGHGQSVAGDGVGIGGEAVERTGATRGDEQGLALKRDGIAAGGVDAGQTRKPTLLQQQVGYEQLVVAGEVLVLEQRVVEGLHLEKAGLVGGQGGAGIGVAAKGPLVDAAVGIASPGDPPTIQQQDLLWRGMDKAVDDILVGQEIGTLYRVPGVELEGIAFVGP